MLTYQEIVMMVLPLFYQAVMIFRHYAAVDAYNGGGDDDYGCEKALYSILALMLCGTSYGHCTSANHPFYVSVSSFVCLRLIFCTYFFLLPH